MPLIVQRVGSILKEAHAVTKHYHEPIHLFLLEKALC